MKNKEITVGIRTFFRPIKLKKCLESLENKEFMKIIIIDCGKITELKRKIYNKAKEKLSFNLMEIEFDSGLGYMTHKIIDEVKTPFLFILDDDMEITNINPLKEILEENKNLGGVTGQLLERGNLVLKAGFLYKQGKTLIRKCNKNLKLNLHFTKSGIPYFIFDFIRQPMLLRKECVDDYKWDKKYKIGFEHLDFLWSQKMLGKWKFAVTPSVMIIHNPGGPKSYLSYRDGTTRLRESRNYFLKKFDVKDIFIYRKLKPVDHLKNHLKQIIPLSFFKLYNKISMLLIKFYIRYFMVNN